MSRRILLLITDLEIGGTPTVVRELAIRLRRATDAHVEVACLSKWGPVADQLRDAGVEVTAFGVSWAIQLPSVVRRLRDFVREHRIDTVFSFLVHANLIAALASRKLDDVRFIQSIQTTQPDPPWHWRVQKWAAKRAEKIVVPSRSVARVAHEWSGIDESKIIVIPNAVDTSEFAISPIPEQNPRPYPIGFVGRLDPIKRIPALLRAVQQLGDLVHLHIFGDGGERATIELEIKNLKIESRVTMHGTIARPQEALQQIGLLILPSKAEGFGLVLIEAMTAGVPIVASDAAGIRDVIETGRNGWLAQETEFADFIRKLVESPEERNEFIRRGKITVAEKYSWERIILEYTNQLGLITSSKNSPATSPPAP